MAKNKNMHKAKKAKNDEFYTRLPDIERELFQYRKHFKGKKVFLNCDDPESSMFWMYFKLNFNFFGLEKLVATHYEVSSPSYKLEIFKTPANDKKRIDFDTIKTPLKQNGDFRSPEAIEILEDCDVVVTNPPFSLFREYIAQLMEYGKEFLIIGNKNAITYKDVFKYIKDGNVWLGIHNPGEFINVDGNETTNLSGLTRWFTNLEHGRRNEELFLYKSYEGNELDYPKYDDYDAIEVSKVKHIPKDYFGVVGVPITFLGKWNPKQFEVLGMSASAGYCKSIVGIALVSGKDARPLINKKNTYARIFIKRK